jgi:hypothetical protein
MLMLKKNNLYCLNSKTKHKLIGSDPKYSYIANRLTDLKENSKMIKSDAKRSRLKAF